MTVAVVLDSRSPTGAVGWNAAASRGRRGREAEEPWLDSAPFRAHVVHVMSASGLSARELAALSHVSVRLIRRLVHGRDGRPVRRIDPLSARRLFGVTALDATLVRSRVVPAGCARATVLLLLTRGRSVGSLARLTGLTSVDLSRLVDGNLTTVCQIVELRLTAALIELDGSADRVADSAELAMTGLADAA
jgi:hypothetical protein